MCSVKFPILKLDPISSHFRCRPTNNSSTPYQSKNPNRLMASFSDDGSPWHLHGGGDALPSPTEIDRRSSFSGDCITETLILWVGKVKSSGAWIRVVLSVAILQNFEIFLQKQSLVCTPLAFNISIWLLTVVKQK